MIIVENWISSSREERTAHLDLTSKCIERGGNSTNHRGVLAQYLNTNIPKKIDLCHACHNDKCSNPIHLYWGTRAENIQDAIDNGTKINPWLATVSKYGIEEAKKMNARSSDSAAKSGQGNKGKTKSEDHKRKISNSLRKKPID